MNIYRGLAELPDFERIVRAAPIIVAALCAFLLPASQDIVARLTERPKTGIAAVLGLAAVAILVELGDETPMSLSTSSSESSAWGRWLATFLCMSALGAW